MNFPDINPIILHIWGPFSITWYSLSYVFGILIGFCYIKYINHKLKLNINNTFIGELISWSIIGIIIGGRLGYVIFYDLSSYLSDPIKILMTWEGGMSFHGGLIGLVIAIYFACKVFKESFLRVLDVISCVAPIGLFLGRIANFINGELYGKVTSMPWGIVFPKAGPFLRHPTQLYESFFEGIVILLVQSFFLFNTKAIYNKGLLSLSFVLQYSLYRFFIEFYREPDAHLGYFFDKVTMGQILSMLMLVVSLIFLRIIKK